jgi:hypothetical protein
MAGILLVVLPAVVYGGVSILSLPTGYPAYMATPCGRPCSGPGTDMPASSSSSALVALRYVDEANLSNGLRRVVREAIPISAILLPLGFFLSVLDPGATEPNALIYLAYAGAVVLAVGLLILGIGLIRKRPEYPAAAGG